MFPALRAKIQDAVGKLEGVLVSLSLLDERTH